MKLPHLLEAESVGCHYIPPDADWQMEPHLIAKIIARGEGYVMMRHPHQRPFVCSIQELRKRFVLLPSHAKQQA